ncbi:MAG TPA: hypothetical protein VLA92_02315 [Candidatus Saccharimonadales bacterium]|nr:hypothetical protein [Candidatus Saccharimonadales bacterium]
MITAPEFRSVTPLADEFAAQLEEAITPLLPHAGEISEDSSDTKPESQVFGPMWVNERQRAPFAYRDEATGLDLALDQEYDGIHLGELPESNRIAARTIMESLAAIADYYKGSGRNPDTILGALTYGKMGAAATRVGFQVCELPVPSNEGKDPERKAVMIHTTIGKFVARHAS